MKKRIIVTAAIAACLALCAAVWPQSNPAKETPVPAPTPAVCAPETNVTEVKAEVKITPLAEKEEAPPTEALTEIHAEPEPMSIEAPEAQPTPEPKATPEEAPEPTPEPTPDLPTIQATVEPQPSDMVYVPGFGWIESQGPNQVEYAEDMYENGNKIGIMG